MVRADDWRRAELILVEPQPQQYAAAVRRLRDQGCRSFLMRPNDPPPCVFRVEQRRYWRPEVSATFHGRDIFAPVTGHLTLGVKPAELGPPVTDWVRLASAPSLWPLQGRIMSSFGERSDPFNGEGAFHRGVDINGSYGQPILAPADGVA